MRVKHVLLVAQTVKTPPTMQETWFRPQGMATQARILAWRIPRTEEPGGPQSMGLQRVRHE